ELEPTNVDSTVGLGQLLMEKDPAAAIEELSKFPDPAGKPTFDDSFVHVELVRAIIKLATDTKDKAMFECEQMEKSLTISGKVMGWDGIDKWVEILDNRGKWDMLRRIYKEVAQYQLGPDQILDETMVEGFFKAKGWDV
ncbi:hypothetical protein CYMTET_43051, partial [Cymbomonas tetramitiformis]